MSTLLKPSNACFSDARVGFGYTMNQMHAAVPPDPRAVRLIEALYASL